MKKNKTIQIIKSVKMDDGIILPEYKKIKVNTNYAKRYFVGYEKRLQLNYCESYLLDFLVEQMDTNTGIISTGLEMRYKFINFILRISQQLEEEIHYKDSTIKTALKKLKELGFIITPPDLRGWAWVNPKYYFQGNEPERYQVIKDIENTLAGNTDSILYIKHNFKQEIIDLENNIKNND